MTRPLLAWTWEFLGETHYLHSEGLHLPIADMCPVNLKILRESGTGIPKIVNQTEDKIQSNAGSVWLSSYLDDRTIKFTLLLHEHNNVGIDKIMRARREVATWFNPSSTAPDGVLTCYSSEVERAINARPAALPFDWIYNEFGEFQMDLELLCADPLWYDPAIKSSTFASAVSTDQITLDHVLPHVLCSDGSFSATANLTNAGDWATFPTIVVTGPAYNVIINNSSTGETMASTYAISAGKTATYNLQYGYKTITDSDGNNLISYLIPGGQLSTFHLAPDSEYNAGGAKVAPGGINSVFVSCGGTAATSVTITWYNRYLTN
jgi:hypothetical protein